MNINSNPYAAAAYRSQASRSTMNVSGTASYFEVTGDTSGSKYAKAAGADSVDISSTVNEMLEKAKSLDVFSCIFPNNDVRQKTKSLGEVESDFMSDFNDFSDAFGRMAGMMGGLGEGESMMMGLTGTGGMSFTGDNEALNRQMADFAGANPTMTSRFAVMAARAALADAGYTEPGFADAYKNDPVKAIQDNIGALKERLLGFRTVAGDGGMQYGFQREEDFEYSETTAAYETEAA